MDLESTNTSFAWHHLDVGFMIKCQNFLTLCEKDDIILKPILGFVNLEDQAGYLREDTYWEENIKIEINRLRANNADFLADILEKTTKKLPLLELQGYLPGFSWHNWGKAAVFKIESGCLDKLTENAITIGVYSVIDTDNDDSFNITTFLFLTDEPKSVEETYDISYVNNYFKEKYERIC